MRTDLQLIQSALAYYDIININTDYSKENKYFKFYSAELPEKYKGLPSIWYFAVIGEQPYEINEIIKPEIVRYARELIREVIENKELPLVILCDVPKLFLNAELMFPTDAIFFLDNYNLPGKNNTPKDVLNIPILVAVRSKFSKSQIPFYFSPYTPMQPVSDWRFFGRKKEVNDIVNSSANYFIVGGRKIGKTSLLQEVELRLKKMGQKVYWIKVQNLSSVSEVINEIALNLSVQEVHRAQKASKILGVDFLTSVLKKLKSDKKKIVLVLDEIGNVLTRDTRDNWNFMGTLRDLSHRGDIRIIASAFQEIIIKQYNESNGPFVNFGNTMKLEVFNSNEIDEFLINPLSLWSDIKDRIKLNVLIRSKFGYHPLILQYMGKFALERVFKQKCKNIDELIEQLLEEENLILFEDAINEVFNREVSYLERFVFLKICLYAHENGKELSNVQINHKDLESILKEVNIKTTLDERTSLLEKLGMRGLLYRDFNSRSNYKIATPIIFTYLNVFDSVSSLCEDYFNEINSLN